MTSQRSRLPKELLDDEVKRCVLESTQLTRLVISNGPARRSSVVSLALCAAQHAAAVCHLRHDGNADAVK